MVCCSLGVHGQQGTVDSPDWQETEVPAPPKYDPRRLVTVDMPPYVSVQFGVDPATLAITPDGVVRYVMVAVSPSGSVNAFYEGIRCAKWEVKMYARTRADGDWSIVKTPQWRGLNDNQPSKHALAFAMHAACEGNASASSVADILKKLKDR